MREKSHIADLCIIGGGLSGVCAAIAAARRGLRVVLMQDRPVLGGNASSEIRMWICGAHGENMRETGILEEIQLENLYRNPDANFSIWDSILYEKVKAETNITLLLNCVCVNCEMDGNKIVSIRGYQLTNETWHTVTAQFFADCSGDSVLAPLTGAEYRVGREAQAEFDESIQPIEADKKTMGMSILFQIRETSSPKTFIPPSFAYKYESDAAFPFKSLKWRNHDTETNFWWIEVGGEDDSIHDTEEIKDELIKIAFGVWDHMKNHGDHGCENWMLEWFGFLPGKRESRRYVGDYVMTQNDVLSQGKFDDLIAYGGWTLDDHPPAGFYHDGLPSAHHAAPSPFCIAYRCLYSKNIENLFFAGRNISVSHAALSATRVMATCSLLGQTVGTAAAIAVHKSLSPRGVYETEVRELQKQLMYNDCYLPFHKREVSELTRLAATDTPVLQNGHDRPHCGQDNIYIGELGHDITYSFDENKKITAFRIIFDSNLNRKLLNMPCNYPLNMPGRYVPATMIKSFAIQISSDGTNFTEIYRENNNYQRHVQIPINCTAQHVRLIPLETWGDTKARIFSWDII